MEKLGVSLDEAAKLTSVSAFTLRRQIKCGTLKVARIGRRLVIPVSELEKLVRPAGDPTATKD
jgi:excisionase family DNA binding protein